MFEIIWKNHEDMWKETQQCFQEMEGIEEIIALQNELFPFSSNDVCFGDAQIDGLAFPPDHNSLTVYIEYPYQIPFQSKTIRSVHYVIDFFDPEIHYFDIEFNTHWIDDVLIQKNKDGKYSISFGMGELDFRYSSAKVNRTWIDFE